VCDGGGGLKVLLLALMRVKSEWGDRDRTAMLIVRAMVLTHDREHSERERKKRLAAAAAISISNAR